MRPYGTRKEDGKYTQPSIVNTPAIQPSPLALLAATCSRIGDTFQQNAPSVFTQKNLATLFEKRIHDNVASRTCAIESRTSDLLCLDRTNTESALDSLQQHFQHHQTQQHQTQQHQQHQQHLQNQLLQQQQQQLLQHQGNHSPTYSTTSPSCFKIKTEESLDYNQNCTENMHICPNIISETRILENQARAAFSKSCCHEPVQSPTSCAHQQINSPQESLSLSTSSACQREIPSPHLPSPTNSSTSSSCLYQTSPLGNQQQQHSSCAVNSMETMKYQSNTLSHLPTPSQSDIVSSNNNNNLMHSQLDSYSKYKPPSINPWQNQHIHRLNGDEHEQPLPPPPQQQQQKSSCMLHENYTSSIPTSSIQSQLIAANSQQERNYRSYSPPEQQARQQFPNFQRQQSDYGHSLESHHPSPHYPGTQGMSPPHHQQQQQQQQQQQSYSYPTSFENSIDVKPDPYTLHQQTMRQQQQQQQQQANIISGVPGTYSTHDPHSHPMNTIPATSPDQLGMPPALQSPHYPIAHNHPAGMTSYSCNACNITNSYQGNFHLPQSPDAVPVNAMTGAPDVPPHFADYQYQQQQMFYSRDNRRPRRIACTCPNCRDGENKTVTTKDGKQRKLHVCHIPGCGKIYGKTSHLRAHLRWHAGERPFACNWLFCNKRFTRSDELQRHRRTHTGDKRFECSICMKKFMRSDHLSKHMKTHQSQQNKQKEKNSNEKTTGNNTTPTEQQQKSKADIQQTAKNNNNVDNINMSAEKTTKVVVI